MAEKKVAWAELSLSRRQELVRQAFDAQFQPEAARAESPAVPRYWVQGVYDGYLVAESGEWGRAYRVDYQVASDGAISFTPRPDWVEVEMLPIAVKGDFSLEVLGLPYYGPFNGKDAQGQWFDDSTRFHEDKFPQIPVVYYHGLTPDGKPAGEPVYLGTGRFERRDERGGWYRVTLDDSLPLARRVIESAKAGKARASSGAVAHLCRYDENGHIREWPVVELSLFDAGEGRRPANPYAVAYPAAKALFDRAGLTLSLENPPETTAPGAAREGAARPGARGVTDTVSITHTPGETHMEENEIKKLVAESVAAALKARQDAEAAAKAQQEAFDAAVKAEVEKQTADLKQQVAAARRPAGGASAPYVARYAGIKRYDNLTIDDLAFWITFVNNALKAGNQLARPLPNDIYQALAVRIHADNGKTQEGNNGLKALLADDRLAAIKANEVMQYDLTAYGDEWARVLYSDNLWYKLRFGTPVLDRMNPYMVEISGAEEMKLLLENTDVVWYKVAEAASLPTTEATGVPNATFTSSRMGSASQSLTLGKLGARVLVSGELSESTPVAVISEVRRQMEVTGREMIENVLINGDTDASATTNINDIGGTPAASDPFLVANGFRKLALVTNSANSRSAGALAIEDFKDTLALMGTGGVNAFSDPRRVSFILDVNTWAKALELAELKTQDVYGAQATVLTGRLPLIYGVEPIMSAEMHKITAGGAVVANSNKAQAADGKINQDSLGDNVAGAILAVRWDQWRMGYRRMMQFETTRIARADVTELVSLAEIGLIYRDPEASAISYGVTL